MSNERDILVRALRASGSEREAQLAEAILPDAPAPPAPPAEAAPGAEAPPVTAAPADVQPAALPEGIWTVEQVAAYEANPPKGLSYKAQEAISDQYVRSAEHHMKAGQ